MKLTVEVTEENIRCGQRYHGYDCPIALAMKAKTGYHWNVGQNLILIREQMTAFVIVSPPEVHRFYRNFDLGQPVNPFTFTIEVPDHLWTK